DDQNAGTDASSGGAVISKPVVPADCGAQFGNSDTFVSVITP
ncbi:MAG: hypothetical protein JWN52_4295, partial [Actinomycetia bacterium]|nr:hypothetical protein [Actinomycetes bacterium]